jgi:RNA polymerase sigma-70 factor, ECF subfamily
MAQPDQTEILLDLAAQNDQAAISKLMAMYRAKLKKMVSVRMDGRLSARVDPSDVVQETLMVAIRQLPDFLKDRPVAFYPWLRAVAMNRLVDLHRRHITAQKRSVRREQDKVKQYLPDESRMQLARQLVHPASSPASKLERAELEKRTSDALAELPAGEREVLVLKYLEELSTGDIAAVLNVAERTVWRRHARAIEQLSALLSADSRWRKPS